MIQNDHCCDRGMLDISTCFVENCSESWYDVSKTDVYSPATFESLAEGAYGCGSQWLMAGPSSIHTNVNEQHDE